MPLAPILKRAYWALAAAGALYLLATFALTVPLIQRSALYAHHVNPTWWQNLTNVEQFGFLHHQVQPFTLVTPDNESLFAWHIVPTHLYLENEKDLTTQVEFGCKDSTAVIDTKGIQLLRNDPNAHVIVNFHGNAGHLASAVRPATYQRWLSLSTPSRPVHVFAIDYRGFGLSTGTPTEQGLIMDAETLVSYLTSWPHSAPAADKDGSSVLFEALGIDPSRIILVGQSLGTAVVAALAHRWSLESMRLNDLHVPPLRGLVLLSGFTSLARLMDSYSIKGIVPPLLSPLQAYPRLHSYVISKIADKWETDHRIADLVGPRNPHALNLTLMHARDDWEIPWREGRSNWNAAMLATEGAGEVTVLHGRAEDGELEIREWQGEAEMGGRKTVRWERILSGGHNHVARSEQAALAVLRILGGG